MRSVYIIFLMSVIILGLSCTKNDDPQSICGAAIRPDTLRFNVFDTETNEDLFFSSSPRYAKGEIYFTEQGSSVRRIPREDSTSVLGKHFFVTFNLGPNSGTIYSHIADLPEDTLSYSTTVRDKKSPCKSYIFDKVYLNKAPVTGNIQKSLIRILK